MNALDLSTNQKYLNKKHDKHDWNDIENLYNFVSTPMAATRDALTERLQSIRETASLLYNRVVDNVGWGDWLKEKKRRKTKEEGEKTTE